MKPSAILSMGVCLLLAGCGTLQIDIDYGWTPASSKPETATPTATQTTPPSPTESPTSGDPTGTPAADTPTPTRPSAIRAVVVSAGEKHTCVLTDAGSVYCWGNNEHGQLGDGTMVNRSVPVMVAGVENARAVAAGWAHTCVLTADGAVKCWGYNKNGELGNGKTLDSSFPVDVIGLEAGVVSIGTKEDHTCAVTAEGGVQCWGFNEFGQLGNGTRISRSVPVDVQGVTGQVRVVVAGWGHTCILTAGGAVQCWGNNEYGQLGYKQESTLRLTPVDVLDLQTGVIGISAAGGQTCALSIGGAVRCWGNNKYGQLGDGTGEIRRSPVAVDGLSQGVSRVAAGWNHACAVMGNGELKCWGWNYYGQLGDETKVTQSRPVNVRRLMEDAVDAAAGWAHTCAVTAAGGVKCWGRNGSGQLGDGTTLDSVVPLVVVGFGGDSAVSSEIEGEGTATSTAAITLTATPVARKKHTPTPTVTAN
jgi:alpha-tubulin suppressor-like RCC1 family protein